MLKSLLSKLHLNFPDPQIEQEFRHHRSQSVSENVRVTSFFLAFFLFSVGIPALIDKRYTIFASSIIAVAVIALIYCSEIFLRNKFGQLMVTMVVLAFNVCRFLFVPNDFNHVTKALSFIRGYAFASLNLMLISQFPEIKQKILAIILSFALRFAVMGHLDSEAVQADTILRNILIDLFVIYNFYLLERRERKIFFNFSQYREELLKFKEFMANHLPQSLIIIDQSASKSLFSNQAFKNLFEQMKSRKFEAQQTIDTVQIVLDTGEPQKLDLDTLKVNKESIREVGTLYPSENQSSSTWVFLEDLKEQLIKDPRLDHKALSFSASYQVEGQQNRSFEVVVMKMKWDKENAVAFMLNDITYQENLLALKMAAENKDRIIATVSHELRTPLTGIIGILGMAEAKIEDPKIRGYLDLCRDNANLLLGLVNSLLDLQQMRKGTLKLNISKIDIRKTIRDVTQLFGFQCNRKNIYLKFHVEKDVPLHINTDENRLKQIFINLIGNAIKFTFTGGIDINISNSLGEACGLDISVVDTGIGIKQEDRDNLFKMYVRLRDGETFNKNGVGLGLMISNALAGLLNGGHDHKNINVTSEYGCGTCFSFAILKDLTDFSPCKSPEKKKKRFDKENYKQQPSLELEENSSYNGEEQGYSELTGEPNLGSKIADYTLLRSVNTNNFESITKLEKVYDKLIHTFEEDHIKIPTTSEEKYVLVVEDNPFNLLIAENYLKDAGYQCKTAGNGQEAIAVIRQNQGLINFKVILMDCQMPIMDGFETTRVLREMMKKKEIPEIPIVALTANHSDEDIHRCYESGMTNCLLKPLQKSLLFETLEKMQSISC